MNRSAIQYMGLIMSRNSVQVNNVLEMSEVLNNSVLNCKDIIVILENIFTHEKSDKILMAVQVLQYLVKNCNRNFHNASNNQSFQKSILGLLKRVRGKSSFFKDITSNKQNWYKIQAKVLYIVQLWYDTFILEQAKFPYIINNYKVLRAQSMIFPPRSLNERNLVFVQTQSPIFDNIETIARADQQKFKKRLNALGLVGARQKMEKNIQKVEEKRQKLVNIDDISQKLAIIQSQEGHNPQDVLKVIESLKYDLMYGKVNPKEQKYWEEIKQAADNLINQWEEKYSQSIKEEAKNYLEKKMGSSFKREEKKTQKIVQNRPETKQETKQILNLLDL